MAKLCSVHVLPASEGSSSSERALGGRNQGPAVPILVHPGLLGPGVCPSHRWRVSCPASEPGSSPSVVSRWLPPRSPPPRPLFPLTFSSVKKHFLTLQSPQERGPGSEFVTTEEDGPYRPFQLVFAFKVGFPCPSAGPATTLCDPRKGTSSPRHPPGAQTGSLLSESISLSFPFLPCWDPLSLLRLAAQALLPTAELDRVPWALQPSVCHSVLSSL